MKKPLVYLLIATIAITFVASFFVNTYISNPGRVGYENYVEFMKTKPVCTGISIILDQGSFNDAADRSLCIGYLR